MSQKCEGNTGHVRRVSFRNPFPPNTLSKDSALVDACQEVTSVHALSMLPKVQLSHTTHVDQDGWNAFLYASMYAKEDIVDALFRLGEHSCLFDVKQPRVTSTVLIELAENLCTRTAVRTLQAFGHKACRAAATDAYGKTALMHACFPPQPELAKALLAHPKLCAVAHVSPNHKTAFLYACQGGMDDVALHILRLTSWNECCANQQPTTVAAILYFVHHRTLPRVNAALRHIGVLRARRPGKQCPKTS